MNNERKISPIATIIPFDGHGPGSPESKDPKSARDHPSKEDKAF